MISARDIGESSRPFAFFINFRITRSGNHSVIVAREYDGSASMKSGTRCDSLWRITLIFGLRKLSFAHCTFFLSFAIMLLVDFLFFQKSGVFFNKIFVINWSYVQWLTKNYSYFLIYFHDLFLKEYKNIQTRNLSRSAINCVHSTTILVHMFAE